MKWAMFKMKWTTFVVAILSATIIYQYFKIKNLEEACKIKAFELISEIDRLNWSGDEKEKVASKCVVIEEKIFGNLKEPEIEKNSNDVLKRLDMLKMHLKANPSEEWVRDVIQNAEKEINNLRENKNSKLGSCTFLNNDVLPASYPPPECPQHNPRYK